MLKDNLKHFSQMDEYASVMTKQDYDLNIDTIADAVDTKLNANIETVDKTFKRYLKSAVVSTTDATQTIIISVLDIPIESVVSIELYSQDLQDDYSTKWILKGTIYATVASDGTITADKSLTDVVKDDADWAFDIAGNNGDASGGASIDLKVTGKDSTNIKWSAFCDIKIAKF